MFSIEKQKPFEKKLTIDEKNYNYFYQGENYEWYINGNLFYIIDKKSIIKKEEIDNNDN